MTEPGWRRAAERTDEARRGLANERTALAWSRSALSLAAIGGLFVRFGAEQDDSLLGYAAGGAALLVAAFAWVYGNVVYTARRNGVEGLVARPRALRMMAVATTAFGVVALVTAVLS